MVNKSQRRDYGNRKMWEHEGFKRTKELLNDEKREDIVADPKGRGLK
jgi:hypothetical protein